MPRGNKRNASGSAGPARRSSRTPAKPEPAPAKKTKGGSSSDASPVKAARKASPSPAPATREGRGRASKASKVEETKTQKGQGDIVESKGRVTRAVVKEKEEETTTTTSRGRSSTRKVDKPKEEPAPTRTSRSKSTTTPKNTAKSTPKKTETPKGGRGQSARGRGKKEEEVEDEKSESEKEEEEVEEEEEPPKKAAAKSTPKGRAKPPAKSPAKAKTPKAQTPSPKKAASPKAVPKPASSRSRSRGGKNEDVSPQVVLEKMDTSNLGTTSETPSEIKSPRGRRAKKEDTKTTPSPRPTRSRRSVQKDEESAEQVKEETTSDKVEETAEVDDVKDTETEKPAESSEAKGDEVEGVPDVEDSKATEDVKDEEVPVVTEKVDEEKDSVDEDKEKDGVDEEMETAEEKVGETETDEKPTEDQTESENVEQEMDSTAVSEQVTEPTVEEEKQDKEPESEQIVEEPEQAKETSVANVEPVAEAVEISDEETSSVVVEPATSEAVQISDDSQSVPADDEPEEPVVIPDDVDAVQSEPIQIEDEAPVPVQNSVNEEPEAMEQDEVQTIEDEDASVPVIAEQPASTDGEQNGQTDCRKRKIEDVEETEEEDASAKRACVTEEPAIEQVQENGETSQTVEEDDNIGKKEITQYMDDVTTLTPEEDYVMVNIAEVPESNSKEVLDSLPQITTQQSSSESVKTNSDSIENLGPLFNRKIISNPSLSTVGSDPSKQFTIVSYNILAQCHLERNDYSFTSPEYLTLEHRHQKMMPEFQFLDADIVCLQEVGPTYFESLLLPGMKSLGYSGIMKKRTEEYFDEGEATFWKDSRFSLVNSELLSVARLADKEVEDAGLDEDVKKAILKYLDMPDVLVLTQLKCNFTNNHLTVGNIHVQWGKMEVPDIQCIQIACAIKALVNLAGSETNPHVLCGDFNSEVTSPGYQLVLEGYLSDSMIDQLQSLANLQLPDGSKKALFNQLYRAFQHPSSNIKSSYLTVQEKEPSVTSYNRVMRAAVDYIFYSANSLDVRGILEVAAESVVTGTGGIPDATFPSDHVSIKSILSFK